MGKYFIVGISWYIRIMIVLDAKPKSSEWVCDGIQWNITSKSGSSMGLSEDWVSPAAPKAFMNGNMLFFKLLHRMRYPLFRHPFVFSASSVDVLHRLPRMQNNPLENYG